jgi:hypothetical protein
VANADTSKKALSSVPVFFERTPQISFLTAVVFHGGRHICKEAISPQASTTRIILWLPAHLLEKQKHNVKDHGSIHGFPDECCYAASCSSKLQMSPTAVAASITTSLFTTLKRSFNGDDDDCRLVPKRPRQAKHFSARKTHPKPGLGEMLDYAALSISHCDRAL